MNKRLVMWGTFLVIFLASIVGSYKFINRNNQDLTIELSAPSLPLVSVMVGEESYNTLHGFTGDVDADDVAQYICPVGADRELHGRIEALGEKVKGLSYEVRNINGSRLIEAGNIPWQENTVDILEFSVKMKDLIEEGEEYIFTIILDTERYEDICYYTHFVYGDDFDLDNQLAFVMNFHDNTLDKNKISEIAQYMETDSSRDNSSLAYVDIYSPAKQVVWDNLPIEQVTEPEIFITYLQDRYGAYALEYYVSSTVDNVVKYYHVVEDFLVSTYGEQIYLLDYERTADCIFQYESDVYQSNKIDLGVQSKEVPVAESDDGNMAAFVVNSCLYYYDDVENQINYVYGFFDDTNHDERSAYFNYDIKVLQVDEAGSMYFIVYGYMNRGNYEGKTGIALYAYDGQNKLTEEIGFWESTRSAAYVMQEVEELSYLSRREKFYFYVDGNVVSYDLNTGTTTVEIPYDEAYQIYISEDHGCLAVDDGDTINFWNLENGIVRKITASDGGKVIPQGFIGNDFVYGIYDEADGVLQSDGTYAQYMREIDIQNAYGDLLKQYTAEGILISGCKIVGNQILLDRVIVQNGKAVSTTSEQIVASKGEDSSSNYIQSAVTASYQTIQQVSLKNKIDTAALEHMEAKEVFYEGRRDILFTSEVQKEYCSVYSPWRIVEYVSDAGEAVLLADELSGYARDASGATIWKKEASSVKNQIMAIELEAVTAERDSKNICLDIMLRQIGSPQDTAEALAQGKTCQEILAATQNDYVWMDITDSSLESMLYYVDRDIPVMVLYDSGEAILITGFNQFNIVIMDPVEKKLGYMSRSDAKEMLEQTENQVFTYYKQTVN